MGQRLMPLYNTYFEIPFFTQEMCSSHNSLHSTYKDRTHLKFVNQLPALRRCGSSAAYALFSTPQARSCQLWWLLAPWCQAHAGPHSARLVRRYVPGAHSTHRAFSVADAWALWHAGPRRAAQDVHDQHVSQGISRMQQKNSTQEIFSLPCWHSLDGSVVSHGAPWWLRRPAEHLQWYASA
jgi:hypothetical protein